ncbi:phage major capsid protein [Tropicimonas sp. IMCC34011]|uniref:phage major capsid protein n=1 Tax=Tropicimonas sp. IMCC34011 TaxID=2248759 RepID=UPI000E281E71|nr:phage major capsid protein [Tropicimonas sp. IMCC34011]
MSETEARATGGKGAPDGDIRAAMDGFLREVGRFRADITRKLNKQDERLTMLDRKTLSATARHALETTRDDVAPHRKALDTYLRNGDDDGLRGLELEGKSMTTTVAADGGYLVDPDTAERISTVLRSSASIRSVATVAQVEAGSFDVLVDHGELGSGWGSETAAPSDSDTPQIEKIAIALHELSAMPKASQRLLDDSAFDIDGWLADRIAQRFARAEAAAFVLGDGLDMPRGFLTHPISEDVDPGWGQIGSVASGAEGDFAEADPLIDLVYALGAEYRANGVFVMNSRTAGAVRKLKDADGRFLWSDGLAEGEPARLLGYRVVIAEDMPDIAPGAAALAFGDFGAGYTIAERPDLRVLRDPFSAKPYVLFYATKRIGGDVTDFSAIKVMRFSAS